jgi:hypothetical protein
MQAFRSFLDNHQVSKGSKNWTHSSLGNPSGIFNITDEENSEFLQLYQSLINMGHPLHMTERHRETSPILIDLDFKQSCPERMYNKTHIEDFVLAVHCILRDITDGIMDQEAISAYILEKGSAPRKNGNYFKDGLHIMFPFFHSKPDLQFELRRQMLEIISDLLPNNVFTNSWNDIYDESVIKRNGWFLYGSNKPDEDDSWKVTYIMKERLLEPCVSNDEDILHFLSIRRKQDVIYSLKPNDSTAIIVRPQSNIDFDRLNQVMKVETEWDVESVDDGFKVTPAGCQCIVVPSIVHSSRGHSVMYVHQDRVVLTCFSHSSRTLDKQTCKIVQSLFGFGKKCSPPKPFEILRDILLDVGKKENLRKLEGNIYKQTYPCTYILHRKYEYVMCCLAMIYSFQIHAILRC